MMNRDEAILGRSEQVRRRWMLEHLRSVLSGLVLVAIWLVLWSTLLVSVAQGVAPPKGAAVVRVVAERG